MPPPSSALRCLSLSFTAVLNGATLMASVPSANAVSGAAQASSTSGNMNRIVFMNSPFESCWSVFFCCAETLDQCLAQFVEPGRLAQHASDLGRNLARGSQPLTPPREHDDRRAR